MVDWNRVITPHPRIAARVIGEQALILDPRSDELQRLNPVGSFIWSCISGRQSTPGDIVQSIMHEFEVEEAIARQDLVAFLGKLEHRGLIAYKTD